MKSSRRLVSELEVQGLELDNMKSYLSLFSLQEIEFNKLYDKYCIK